MSSSLHRISGVVMTAVLAAIVAAIYVVTQVDRHMNSILDVPEEGAGFDIPGGSSFAFVANKLVAEEYISTDRWLQLYVRWHDLGGAIKAGDYWIESGATLHALLKKIIDGDVRLYDFTLVEGWNSREVLAALHSNNTIKATMSEADWPALLESLGAKSTHPEGLFLPETYLFSRNSTDKDVLSQAYHLMQSVLAEEWAARSEDSSIQSQYETLILASIVEKETARADERAKIAGVFARRLEKRMRLQTDPTVIYGVGPEFDGNLTRTHLKTDTPYNTYTRHGLPPTPIAMPGRAAINAALNPEVGAALFFVATGLGDGSHKFSATKAEHDAAVAEYLLRLRQQRRTEVR